jgi:ankyrin repeat protein
MVRLTRIGSTQLMRAAYLNNLPRVLQLIQLGAPLDLVDKNSGWSALHWASNLGHEDVVKALLDGRYEVRGATVDLRDKDGWTPLISASSYSGTEGVVRLLLSRGAKQELQNVHGFVAMHAAAVNNQPGILALLCAAPGAAAALATKSVYGATPLALAIRKGNVACEAVLRAHGALE